MLLKSGTTELDSIKDVFVSGGYPEKTYISRESLENAVKQAINTNRLISITGVTKSGKTVLTQSLFREDAVIRVDAGEALRSDFWQVLAGKCPDDALKVVEYSVRDEKGSSRNVAGKLSLCGCGVSGDAQENTSTEEIYRIQQTYKEKLAEYFRKNIDKKVLIIDDFHYLNDDIKKDIVRYFKGLVYEGLNVVLISVPHRSHEAATVENEMQGRLCPIFVEMWAESELQQIAEHGFSLLGKELDAFVSKKLAKEAFGSPHLMQAFCREIGFELINKKTYKITKTIGTSIVNIDEVFSKVANEVGRKIFKKMVMGPRGERKRIKRKLKDGREVDTYGLVAHTFAEMQSGMSSIKISNFVTKAQELCATKSPASHEITRVLQYVAKEATYDSASNSVIDLDLDQDRTIYIVDPFFAFYLKWGDCSLDD